MIIIKRFLSQPVPSSKKKVFYLVENNKGKHAVKMADTVFPIFQISSTNNFSVTCCIKGVALGYQNLFDFLKIIDFTIKNQVNVSLIGERLVGTFVQIYNGQPVMAKNNLLFFSKIIKLQFVRTSKIRAFQFFIDLSVIIRYCRAVNSTHIV